MMPIICNKKINGVEDNSLILAGSTDKPVIIFIHGLASYVNDLLPLAESFNDVGHTCELIALTGHGGSTEDLANAKYSDWYQQLVVTCEKYNSLKRDIFLVGFSIGATLALDYSMKNEVKGVIAIETFLAKTYGNIIFPLFNMYKLFKFSKIKRFIRTTTKNTKNELCYNSHFPVNTINMVRKETRRVRNYPSSVKCPVLFFHSLEDRVADYKETCKFSKEMSKKNRIIPFRQLSHFVQFDIPPSKMRDVILCYFKIKHFKDISEPSPSIYTEIYRQAHQEHRLWAEIIFKLMFGFFTVFGTLLYKSLTDVVTKEASAPYYLFSYSFVINIYIILGTLYMFYMIRTIVHIKNYLEPSIEGLTMPTMYRHNKYMSSETSQKMTRGVTSVLFTLPYCLSISSVLATIYMYYDRLILIKPNNLFLIIQPSSVVLQIWMLIALISLYYSTKLMIGVMMYTKKENWVAQRPVETNYKIETLLARMYLVISPGCVQQSKKYY